MVYKYLYQWMGKLLQLSEEFPKPSKVFSGALFATYFMASQNEGNMPISYISISVNYTFLLISGLFVTRLPESFVGHCPLSVSHGLPSTVTQWKFQQQGDFRDNRKRPYSFRLSTGEK